MQTTAKTNSRVTSAWAGDILTISVLGAGDVMFDRTRASADNRDYAERHGWNARFIDRAAMSVDKATGRSASPGDKLAAIQELVEHYEAGDVPWKMSGGGGGGDSLLLRALMEYSPLVGRETWQTRLAAMDKGAKARLASSTKILPIINRLRAKAAGDVDTDELLGELIGEASDEG